MNLMSRCQIVFVGVVCLAAALFVPASAQDGGKVPDAKGTAKEAGKESQTRDEGAAQLLKAYELSKTATAEKDFSQMIELCEKGIAATSSDKYKAYGKKLAAFSHYRRGDLRASANPPQEKEALADFEASVSYLADTPTGERPDWEYHLLHNRGVSYLVSGKLDKALTDFNQVLKLKPDHGKDYFNRAEIFYAQKKLKEALADYEAAIRHGYEESKVYTGRGSVYFRTGDMRRAMTDYNLAIARNNQDHQAYTFRGDAFFAEGNYPQALRDYQRALSLNEKFGRAHYSLGWLRATCSNDAYRDGEAALRSAKRAIELDGEDYRYLECLAAAQARTGQFDDAVATQKKALDIAAKEEKDALTAAQDRLKLYEKKQPLLSPEPAGVIRVFP